ncbi:MAG TPA: IclR family transcriptional regulator [Actinomadura sp.]|nr:IclR family transcriptional regulator [Actinomadura sp.]
MRTVGLREGPPRGEGPDHGPARTAAGRLLDVLDAFSADHPVLTLSEISRRAGMSLTTTHRLVGELTCWGGLQRDERGRYRIGLRLLEVASLSPGWLGLREAALPFMEDLYEVTHENVQLGVRDGLEVVYVDRIAGRAAVGVFTRVGGRWPLHASGVGLVLLAHADPEVQERALAAPLKAYTEKTIVDPQRLRRVLADVRRTGVAVSDGQVTLDALSVAAPIRGPSKDVIAALSIVVLADNAEPRALIPAVTAAARGISRGMGFSEARPGADGRGRRTGG